MIGTLSEQEKARQSRIKKLWSKTGNRQSQSRNVGVTSRPGSARMFGGNANTLYKGDTTTMDPKLISDVVMQLNIVRKNTALYPDGHPQLKMAMARVATVLGKYFHEAHGQDLVLGVVGDSIVSGEVELPGSNAAVAEFAAFLHDKAILSLIIKKGATREELIITGRVLSEEPLPGMGRTDVARILEAQGVRHVTVSQLDYNNLQFTDDPNYTESDDSDSQAGEEGWQGLVRSLLGQTVFHDDGSVSLSNIEGDKVAEFLNQLEQQAQTELSFSKIASRYLEELEAGSGASQDSKVKTAFVEIVKALAPEPRLDFLKEVFDFSSRAPHIAAEILRQIPGSILLNAIKQVKESDSTINPAILALVDQLAARSPEPEQPKAGFQGIPRKEQQELKKNTAAFLSMAGLESGRQTPSARSARQLEEYTNRQMARNPQAGLLEKGELQDPLLTSFRFAELTLDLFEKAPNEEQAMVYAKTLMAILWENLSMARWDVLEFLWAQMEEIGQLHEYDKPHLESVRLQVTIQFWEVENISFIATALLEHGMDDVSPLVEVVDRTGPRAGECLVEALAQEDNKSVRGVLLKLISHTPRPAMPYVLERLDDSRWFVVRNMLAIIKTVGDDSAVEKIEDLASGGHPKVRIEALRALARVGTARTPELILDAIHDPEHEIAMGGISVAGLIFDRRITESLLDLIKDHKIKDQQGLARRIRAIKALAEIKDSGVLEDLHEIVTARVLFAGPGYDRIKLEIYRSLKHYPVVKLDAFIQTGLQDSNVQVVDRAKRLLARQRKALTQQ